MKRVAIITSHPIQYNAPLFRMLHERGKIQLKVFYTWGQALEGKIYDPDFKKEFSWDIPLLEGYAFEAIKNYSTNPGAGHFKGIINKGLLQKVEAFSPDTLIVYGWSFQSHLKAIRHFSSKTKLIIKGDSTLLDERIGFSVKKLLRRVFLKWVYSHARQALYSGIENKKYLLKHGLKEYQLLYTPHAVDNNRFADADGELQKKADAWKQKLGIGNDDIVFLFAGKLEPKKDPLLLLEAFRTLAQKNVKLIIVGNGVLEEQLKQIAASDNRIIFLDFQNQQTMPIVYRLADVFVLPSQGPGETWGLSVNEAMACGRPVIVSDKCGCAPDLVKENGRVFKARSVSELSAALNFLSLNPDCLKEMSVCSLDIIRDFTFDKIADAIELCV